MPFEHVTWDLVLIVKNVRIRTLSLYLLRYRIKVLPQSHFSLYIRTLSFRLRSQSSIRTGFYDLPFGTILLHIGPILLFIGRAQCPLSPFSYQWPYFYCLRINPSSYVVFFRLKGFF